MADYTVKNLSEIDEISDGRSAFRPIRLDLGITSFGVNSWTGHEVGDRIINEHDEEGESEELYLVQSGTATFELDGERAEAPVGTLVHVQPGVKRAAFAAEPQTTILSIGGSPGEVYEPDGWELWAPFTSLYEQGRYGDAADQARETVDAHPEYSGLLYNVACCESLAGRPADAARHLRLAIEGSEKFRGFAEGDSDFDPIREDPGFRALFSG